jgi:hypothetical protein
MAWPNDKAEAEEKKPQPEFKKSREYRRFRKLIKSVIKAPPLQNIRRL